MRTTRPLLVALLGLIAFFGPRAAAAQTYPWQRLDAVGDSTGFVSAMVIGVTLEDGLITATIEERHFNGSTITLKETAALSDLNVMAGDARESNRSIHPHLGIVTFECRGNAECVEYSTDEDVFFELPGPRVFGFFAQDAPMAQRALADLKKIYEGGR